MSLLSRFRASQPASSSGAGLHVVSPEKTVPKRKSRRQPAVTCLNRERKKQRLMAELALLSPSKISAQGSLSRLPDSSTEGCLLEESELSKPGHMEIDDGYSGDVEESDRAARVDDVKPDGLSHTEAEVKSTAPPSKKKRTCPNEAAKALHSRWKDLLPTLINPLLSYISGSTCKPLHSVDGDLKGVCTKVMGKCCTKSTRIICLYFDQFLSITVTSCECESISQILVRHGLFPTAPAQIRMAISLDLLDFYDALFEQSCDAVNAMAAALNSFYGLRGYFLVNGKDERFKEPFRKGFGYASQWLGVLRVMVDDLVDSVLDHADSILVKLPPTIDISAPFQSIAADMRTSLPNCGAQRIIASQQPVGGTPPLSQQPVGGTPPLSQQPVGGTPPLSQQPVEGTTPSHESPTNLRAECSRRLRQLCPACFGGTKFGSPLEDGGDFQIATDGNFHHRHLVSAGESVPFYDAKHIIPKTFVDAVGDHIAKARKCRPKSRTPKVPDCAVDECEKSHEAADGDKKKAAHDRYDDMGWMSLVCRHDIPLFFANIDTPGEQQKYAIALILWFFSFIPPNATVTALYDVGCVVDRSISLFDILPDDILPRLQFVTTAMHAYRHQWSCQLQYNPRLCAGLGLTDGEGVERIWSRLRKLIPIVRTTSRARRQYLTDRQLSRFAQESRANLGDWIKHRQRRGVQEQGERAKAAMLKSGVKEEDLRAQWSFQKAAQSSLRAHAPVRVRKELDMVLNLQSDLEMVEKTITTMESTLQSSASAHSKTILTGLHESRRLLTANLDALYVSLNVFDEFPDLKGINLDFIHTLFMARDLKINIRKRAVGSFFEWDRLDQAVGGRNQTLGTKLHQQTRQAISKRAPALTTAIKKFNQYCVKLADLHDSSWNIPVPLPLPTKLADLRDDSNLMEDVWVTRSEVKAQAWLTDPDVRTGIRAMLKYDRCIEEQKRLGREADNLCSWFGREIAAVELALRLPQYAFLIIQLSRRRDELIHLKSRWTSPLASSIRFETHVNTAVRQAEALTGQPCTAPLKWIVLTAETGSSPERDGDALEVVASEFLEDDAQTLTNEDNEQTLADADDEQTFADADPSDIIVSDILRAEEDGDLINETSDIRYSEEAMVFQPGAVSLKQDHTLVDFIRRRISTSSGGDRYQMRRFGSFVFAQRDLRLFDTPNAPLNDISLNGSAAILQDLFVRDPVNGFLAQNCSIFSTHDLNRIRYNVPDDDLWRNTHQLEFWTKETWILPIHRKSVSHWVLAVIYLRRQEVYLFDSLAQEAAWKRDVEDISVLISRLIELARRAGHIVAAPTCGWVAKPATVCPVQSNDYDCGLWVLAWISAILRGYEITAPNLSEKTIPSWRNFLGDLIRAKAPLS